MVFDEVFDLVFVECMMGDGVVIDLIGDCLYVLCDVVVVSVYVSGYVIMLCMLEGVEILMYIGFDIVVFGGCGFIL